MLPSGVPLDPPVMEKRLILDDGRFVAMVRPFVLGLALRLVVLARRLGIDPSRFAGLLCFGWGNLGWAARSEFVAAVMADAYGPALECGSGLTTLVLAALGVETHALEHDGTWAEHVRGQLRRHHLTSATVHYAPLRPGVSADWYDWPPVLDSGTHFRLVVCDGPPGSTRGGRSGMEEVRHLLEPGCVILLDDVERDAELALVHQWESRAWSRVTESSSYARMISLP